MSSIHFQAQVECVRIVDLLWLNWVVFGSVQIRVNQIKLSSPGHN